MYKTLLLTHICVHMYIEELFLYFQLKVSNEGLADSQKTLSTVNFKMPPN